MTPTEDRTIPCVAGDVDAATCPEPICERCDVAGFEVERWPLTMLGSTEELYRLKAWLNLQENAKSLALCPECVKATRTDLAEGRELPPLHLHSGEWLVMQGDWGGQIYLTVPRAWVHATNEEVEALLRQIDRACWACNRDDGADWYVRPGQAGEGVMGGMGGGILLDALWRHDELAGVPASILPGYHTEADLIRGDVWRQRIIDGLKLRLP